MVITMEAAATLGKRRAVPASTTSSATRAAATLALKSSNTGLPGAFKPPPPPVEDRSGRTFGKPKRGTPAPTPPPVTSNDLPRTPTPVSGGAGVQGSGAATGFPDLPGDVPAGAYASGPDEQERSSASSSLLTPTNIAIGVGALALLALAAKALR